MTRARRQVTISSVDREPTTSPSSVSDALPISEPLVALKATCVRHDRGTLYVLITLVSLANIGVYTLLFYLWFMHEQVYAVPDIYATRDVTLQWGGYEK